MNEQVQQLLMQYAQVAGLDEQQYNKLLEELQKLPQEEQQATLQQIAAVVQEQSQQQQQQQSPQQMQGDPNQQMQQQDIPIAESGIHIKPENKGKFTRYADSKGMGVQEAAHWVMAHSKNPTLRKRANFALNAAKFKHAEYGENISDRYIKAEGGMSNIMGMLGGGSDAVPGMPDIGGIIKGFADLFKGTTYKEPVWNTAPKSAGDFVRRNPEGYTETGLMNNAASQQQAQEQKEIQQADQQQSQQIQQQTKVPTIRENIDINNQKSIPVLPDDNSAVARYKNLYNIASSQPNSLINKDGTQLTKDAKLSGESNIGGKGNGANIMSAIGGAATQAIGTTGDIMMQNAEHAWSKKAAIGKGLSTGAKGVEAFSPLTNMLPPGFKQGVNAIIGAGIGFAGWNSQKKEGELLKKNEQANNYYDTMVPESTMYNPNLIGRYGGFIKADDGLNRTYTSESTNVLINPKMNNIISNDWANVYKPNNNSKSISSNNNYSFKTSPHLFQETLEPMIGKPTSKVVGFIPDLLMSNPLHSLNQLRKNEGDLVDTGFNTLNVLSTALPFSKIAAREIVPVVNSLRELNIFKNIATSGSEKAVHKKIEQDIHHIVSDKKHEFGGYANSYKEQLKVDIMNDFKKFLNGGTV